MLIGFEYQGLVLLVNLTRRGAELPDSDHAVSLHPYGLVGTERVGLVELWERR
jgi:hypothetical protein